MALIYPVILCGGSGARLWPLVTGNQDPGVNAQKGSLGVRHVGVTLLAVIAR